MGRKKKAIVDATTAIKDMRQKDWHTLRRLIEDYKECSIADVEKGGGDPLSIPEIELQLQLAEVKLHAHIERMKREEDPQ